MRWKTTVVLLIATIGIGAYLSLYEIRQPPPEDRARLAQQVVRLTADEVTQLVLDLPNVKVTLSREGTTWRLAPQQLRADPALTSKLLGALDPLIAERILSGSAEQPLNPNSYGLDPAVGWMSVVSPAGPTTLLFGETTPVAGNRYVQVKGRPEIFVVSAGLFDDANQALEQFRDPLLMRVDTWQADGLTVVAAGSSFTLTRTARAWQIASTGLTGPHPSPEQPWTDIADRGEVTALFQRIAGVSIERFLEETPLAEQAATFGFDQPRAEVTLQQKDQPSVTLFFGKPLPDNNSLLYAKRSDEPALYAVTSANVEVLVRDPHGLRSKQCFDFFTSEVTKVEVVREQTRWLIQRSQDQWKAEGEDAPLDQERIEQFLDELGDLNLSGFVDDAPVSLSAYGLDPPAGTISVWTIGDTPIQRLLVGSAIDNSSNRYGRIDGRPAVVRLPEAASDPLAKTLDSLHTPPPPSPVQPAPQPTDSSPSPSPTPSPTTR
jgi:hypothetical protein